MGVVGRIVVFSSGRFRVCGRRLLIFVIFGVILFYVFDEVSFF